MLNGELARILRSLSVTDMAAQYVESLSEPRFPSPWSLLARHLQDERLAILRDLASLSLADAVTSVQNRSSVAGIASDLQSAALSSFVQWEEHYGSVLQQLPPNLSNLVAEPLKWNYIGADLAASQIASVAERFGRESPITLQGNLLLDSYREFVERLTPALASSSFDEQASSVAVAGSAVGTPVLCASAALLEQAEESDGSSALEATAPTFFSALSIHLAHRRPEARRRSPAQATADLQRTRVSRIARAADRLVDGWHATNEAALLNGYLEVLTPSNEAIFSACKLQTLTVRDRQDFDLLMDYLYKLVVDAAKGGGASDGEVKQLRTTLSNASVIESVHVLRNHYSHAATNPDNARRRGRKAGEIFQQLCGVRAPHTPAQWHQVQLGILTGIGDVLHDLARNVRDRE